MNERTAYPLSWPTGWPRTEMQRRELGTFRSTLNGALENLKRQIALLGGKGLVLSSNYTLGVSRPQDPGVVAYFEWQAITMAIPCDRWQLIEHNVQAIALTVEAMRGMERWGAKHMIKAMFTGFKALPESTGKKAWWIALGVSQSATDDQVKEAYRILAKRHHPDAGGSADRFREVQEAYDEWQHTKP